MIKKMKDGAIIKQWSGINYCFVESPVIILSVKKSKLSGKVVVYPSRITVPVVSNGTLFFHNMGLINLN